MKPQGTITKFLSKPIIFEATHDGNNGGGHLKVGVGWNGVGAGWKTPDDKFRCKKRPRGQTKFKAAAKSKKKRGGKSKTGKGAEDQGSDSSQSLIMKFFEAKERPGEIGNSLGNSQVPTNTNQA